MLEKILNGGAENALNQALNIAWAENAKVLSHILR